MNAITIRRRRGAAVLGALALAVAGGLVCAPPAAAQSVDTLDTPLGPVTQGAKIQVSWTLIPGAQDTFVANAAAGGVEVDAGTLSFTATSGGEQTVVIPLTKVGEVTDGEQIQVTVSDTQSEGGAVVDEDAVTATLTCHPNPDDPGWMRCQ